MGAHERENVCPPLWELLLADARELPAADQRRIEGHAAQCSACGLRLQRANALVHAYGVIEDTAAASSAMPSMTLMQPGSLPKSRWLGHCPFRRAMLVVAAALVAIVAFTNRWQAPLEAEELLQRVVRAEQTAPERGDEMVDARFTSSSGVEKANLANLSARRGVREGLRAYGWDDRNPLSITTFRRWRDGLAEKSDHIRKTVDTLEIRTVTRAGWVREAELVIESSTFQVIALRLTFEAGRLEVTEVRRQDRDAFASTLEAAKPAPPPAPVAPAASPEAASNGNTGNSGTAAVARPGLSKWIARKYGANPVGRSFMPQTESFARNIARHLDALHHLAMRSPATNAATAASDDRVEEPVDLERQVQEHFESARDDLTELDRRLAFLFTDLGVQSSRRRHDVPADWRERVAVARKHASELKELLSKLGAHDDLVPAEHPAGAQAFASTLRELWTAMNEADRDES